jgi:peroxiredoxin
MIKPGDPMPDATLFESLEFGDACPLPPQPVKVPEALAGKRVVIFGLPGAFTPTCSAKHLPGYLTHLDALRDKGVDEVWCVSVNDGAVMAAWGREQDAIGKLRMLGDGAAELTKKLGLAVEIPGMGVRLQRCSLLVEDGVVKQLNLEEPRAFGVSSAETMLRQLG